MKKEDLHAMTIDADCYVPAIFHYRSSTIKLTYTHNRSPLEHEILLSEIAPPGNDSGLLEYIRKKFPGMKQ